MHDQVGEAYNYFKLAVGIVSLVVVVLNAMLSLAIGLMWRTFNVFKSEIKETLRDFISREGSNKIEMQSEIETLMRDCHDIDVTMAKLMQSVESCQTRCAEWRRICRSDK